MQYLPAKERQPGRKRRLAWHLSIILILKVVLLATLWNIFIKPHKVSIDAKAMGDRITRNAHQQQLQEKANDRLDGR